MRIRLIVSALLLSIAALVPLAAQQRASVTAADYGRAEKMLAQNLNGLVIGGNVSPVWLPDDRFWYRDQTATGENIVVVDPAKGTRQAFPNCAAVDVEAAVDAAEADAEVAAAVASSHPTTSR
jgi:hypothetical protein